MRSLAAALLVVLASCSRPPAPREEVAGAPAPPPAESPAIASADDPTPPARCDRPSARAALAPFEAPLGGGVVLALLGARKVALVADADTRLVHTVDLDAKKELARTPVAGEPSALLVAPDGRVAVALRDRGAIQLLDAGPTPESPLVPVCETAVPAEPVALGFGAGSLLVVSRWAAKLTALGLPGSSGVWARRAERALERDPAALVVTNDRVVVLHAVGGVLHDVALSSLAEGPVRRGVVATVLPQPLPPKPAGPGEIPFRPTPLPLVGTQGFGLTVDPASGRVFAALALALPAGTIGAVGYGGPESSLLGRLALLEPSGEPIPFVAVPRWPPGPPDCSLPRAAAFDRQRAQVLVACAGLDVLAAFDVRPEPVAPGASERPPPRQLGRWNAKVGAGPRAVAVDPGAGRAWVWGAFDGTLTEVDLASDAAPPGACRPDDLGCSDPRRTLGVFRLRERPALAPAVTLGRALFHDPSRRVSADRRACASCHLDGRDDGITWATGDGPRQTQVLLGRLEGTAPYGWEGDQRLEGHFQRTMRRLGGSGLSAEERDAIFAYVASLAPPSSDASASERIARGAAVFASAAVGCATCHPTGTGVDGMQHDVRSRTPLDRASRFDTPSLRFVGRSAPYFHDGRYATLAAVLDGTSGTMGHTKQLSADDRAALLAFLENL